MINTPRDTNVPVSTATWLGCTTGRGTIVCVTVALLLTRERSDDVLAKGECETVLTLVREAFMEVVDGHEREGMDIHVVKGNGESK